MGEGYRTSSVMENLDGMRGDLLLVHGLIDENVHFRHTARLINSLIAAQKPYQLLLFPSERHSPRSQKEGTKHATNMSRNSCLPSCSKSTTPPQGGPRIHGRTNLGVHQGFPGRMNFFVAQDRFIAVAGGQILDCHSSFWLSSK